MKRIVTARLYALDHADTRHQLTGTSAADLAQQVQAITANKTAASLARAAWGDDAADVRAAGVRLVSLGAVVRELWRTLPPLKGQDEGFKAGTRQLKSDASGSLSTAVTAVDLDADTDALTEQQPRQSQNQPQDERETLWSI